MAYSEILLEASDGVAVVTLNRPEKLNAYTSTMGRELAEAFAACDADDAVRAIIVTPADKPWAHAPRAISPWEVRKPIIGAINGPAVGVGATLPMQWDIRLAAESAKIGFVFVRRGLVPEAISTWTLPRTIGLARAAELMLTGRVLSAREALDYGIVSRVVPDAELLPAARALAAEIAREAAPVSVALTKWLLWHMQGVSHPEDAEELDSHVFWWATTQPDVKEGVAGFREKRAPRWSMRPSRDMPDFLPAPGRTRTR